MQTFSFVADLISIAGGIFALFAWIQALRLRQDQQREKIRRNQRIAVSLHYGDQRLTLPVEFRRDELTRPELLGRLGMIPRKAPKEPFSIRYLGTADLYRQLDQIAEGGGDMALIIPCTEEEFNQFDVPS